MDVLNNYEIHQIFSKYTSDKYSKQICETYFPLILTSLVYLSISHPIWFLSSPPPLSEAHLWQVDISLKTCRKFASARKGKVKSNEQPKPSSTSRLNCFALLKKKLFTSF